MTMHEADRPRRSRIPDATGERVDRTPLRGRTGYARGGWRIAIAVLVTAVAAFVTVLVLVDQDVLAHRWTYVALPLAIAAAPIALALTVFKASAEGKRH